MFEKFPRNGFWVCQLQVNLPTPLSCRRSQGLAGTAAKRRADADLPITKAFETLITQFFRWSPEWALADSQAVVFVSAFNVQHSALFNLWVFADHKVLSSTETDLAIVKLVKYPLMSYAYKHYH